VRPDGNVRILHSQGKVITSDSGEVVKVTGVCLDVTEQRHLRERLLATEQQRFSELRRYASSVQRAQEEERQRVARELHDDLCQRLSGMKLNVEVIADEVRPRDKTLHRRLQTFNKQCEELIADVRRMSVNLRPTVLDDFGLVIALELLIRDFEKLHKVPVTLETDGSTRLHLEPQLEIALYRIAQEGLSNIAKHAQATMATLVLHRKQSTVIMRIEDNGKGFGPGDAGTRREPHSGLGLISMRERSELFGGSLAIDSAQGRGTTVTISIPLIIETKHEEDALAHR
jgi:two-component system sensor histidine kinase UhpB